ncbi:UNVERIFIED_CONTAM: DNA-directed RNA polymerase [Siphonaria sp. JEL0065]|nr:DNA-directed RNA polymerase [Siphonaria sp. JEL0065]
MSCTRSNEHIAYLAAADERQTLSGVCESLDVLGKTPWKVNEKVYAVMKQIWNSGDAIADFPPVEEENAKSSTFKKPENWESMAPKDRKEWTLEKTKAEAKRRNDINYYKIDIARSVEFCFIGQTIYFPHILDFRSRAYPMPAHLNHMGNDFCRGLLMLGTKRWENEDSSGSRSKLPTC